MNVPVDDLYRAAIRLHQQGRGADASRLYDQILAAQPSHPGALHLKGVLALQAGDYPAASRLIEQSVALEPRHALAYSNLGIAYRAQDRMLESIAALETAIGIDPKMGDAWVNLAQSQLRAARQVADASGVQVEFLAS